MRRTLFVGAALLAAAADGSPRVLCYEQPGSLQHTCIDVNAVAGNGSLRSAPLYTGGPKAITKTQLVWVSNCTSGTSSVQDGSGVNIAGAASTKTAATRAISKTICDAAVARTDKQLRQ